MAERAFAALDPKHSAGERLLRTALSHFDRILTQRDFQSLMQQEMVRMRRGESDAMPALVKNVFKPLLGKLEEAVHEGIESGELCQMDWLQVVYSALGANVLYFLSAPMMRLLLPFDPFTPAAIESRRKAAVQFLGNALFVDRAHGARLAKRVLADMPMPKASLRSSLEKVPMNATQSNLYAARYPVRHLPLLVLLFHPALERSAADRHGRCQRGSRQLAYSGQDSDPGTSTRGTTCKPGN